MYSCQCIRCRGTFEADRQYTIYCPDCLAKEKAEAAARQAKKIARGVEAGEFCSEPHIYCPHCGHEMEVDDDYELYEEGEHKRTCGLCNKAFLIETEHSIDYSTRKPEDEENEDAEDS